MNCLNCLDKGRKSFAYFDIDGEPICLPCFLWEPPTLAEQERKKLYNQAHSIVTSAKRRKILTEEPCEICGSVICVEAHHEDYSKPLEVRWLCDIHHRQVTSGKLKLSRVPLEQNIAFTPNLL